MTLIKTSFAGSLVGDHGDFFANKSIARCDVTLKIPIVCLFIAALIEDNAESPSFDFGVFCTNGVDGDIWGWNHVSSK